MENSEVMQCKKDMVPSLILVRSVPTQQHNSNQPNSNQWKNVWDLFTRKIVEMYSKTRHRKLKDNVSNATTQANRNEKKRKENDGCDLIYVSF